MGICRGGTAGSDGAEPWGSAGGSGSGGTTGEPGAGTPALGSRRGGLAGPLVAAG